MTDTRFQPGNPGRPPGIRDKRTALRGQLEPHAPELIAAVVAKAKEGDMAAMRLCLERLLPPVKARDEPVTIPHFSESIADNARIVVQAMGTGEITPDQAAAVLAAFASQVRVVEAAELEHRIAALERAAARNR
ncbi:MAG: hypothetical protein U1F41_02570 [Burkholderiales bacterium]